MKLSTIFTNVAVLLILLAATSTAWSQSSTQASGEFALQGRLTSTTGSAIADGQHTLTTTVYSKTSGQVVYTETDNVMTVDGIFSAMVGDNGSGSLMIDATSDYELGVKVDGQPELAPRIPLGSSVRALTSELAANANTVGGFGVSTSANPQANTVVALNASGKLPSSLLEGGGLGSTINGITGAVTIQGGGDLNVTTLGNTISLSLNGSTSGSLNYPYLRSVDIPTGSAFSLTNTLAGSTGSFVNTGTGTAVNAQATSGSAITATSSGLLSGGSATITADNSAGAAISLTSTSVNDAVMKIQNKATAASARLINAVNSIGTTVLDVAANGKTTITASVGNALDVTTSAAGEAALKVTGGLTMSGPVGTSAVLSGQLSATVTNSLAKANSIILVTVTGSNASNEALGVSAQGSGSFTVSVLDGTAATGNVSFNYLIINQ